MGAERRPTTASKRRRGGALPFRSAMRDYGLVIETDAMSSTVTGQAETVFEALRVGFLAAAGDCVLVATVSNTCPQESGG